jgi:hypothetical protein
MKMLTIQAGLVLPFDVLRIEALDLEVETVENREGKGLIRIDFTDWNYALICDSWRELEAVDLGPRLAVVGHAVFPRIIRDASPWDALILGAGNPYRH